jgi:hypothetical protein
MKWSSFLKKEGLKNSFVRFYGIIADFYKKCDLVQSCCSGKNIRSVGWLLASLKWYKVVNHIWVTDLDTVADTVAVAVMAAVAALS